MDDITSFYKSKGIPVAILKKGDFTTTGRMRFQCIFQADADKLPEKEDHHFINNMSMVLRVTLGQWTVLTSGDASADALKQMLSAGISEDCDIFFFNWHSDRGGITTEYAEKMHPVLAFTQYHSAEKESNGRKSTHDLLRKQGALVVRSYEEGDIRMIISDKRLRVITESGSDKVFRKE